MEKNVNVNEIVNYSEDYLDILDGFTYETPSKYQTNSNIQRSRTFLYNKDGNICKKCSVCGEWKTKDQYYSDKSKPHEIGSRCIICDSEYRKDINKKPKKAKKTKKPKKSCNKTSISELRKKITRKQVEKSYVMKFGEDNNTILKWCCGCYDWHPIDEFNKGIAPTYCHSYCRKMVKIYNKDKTKFFKIKEKNKKEYDNSFKKDDKRYFEDKKDPEFERMSKNKDIYFIEDKRGNMVPTIAGCGKIIEDVFFTENEYIYNTELLEDLYKLISDRHGCSVSTAKTIIRYMRNHYGLTLPQKRIKSELNYNIRERIDIYMKNRNKE